MTYLRAWENFYVIIGSSAGALTGLQFVVLALVIDIRSKSTEQETSTFSTPTLVHFTAALIVSAILSAPWPNAVAPSLALAVFGATGIVYAVVTAMRTKRQTTYKPVLEDWLWYTFLPLGAYTTLAVAGIVLSHNPPATLFAVGAAVLLLLVVGIHNAWDSVTYVASGKLPPHPAPLQNTSERPPG